MNIKDYIKEDGDKFILNTYKCEIYVPEQYFGDMKLAVQNGEIFDLLFIVKYRLIHKETDSVDKLPLYEFSIPTMIATRPDEITTEEMSIYGEKEKIRVFTYYKGAELISNKNIVRTSIMVEKFINLLLNGKIRADYTKINNMINMSQKIHGVKLNVPQNIQQLVVSEVYRDASDYSKPARLVTSSTNTGSGEIKALNMRENSAFTSTLAGVGFEDIRSMLTIADNRNDKDDTSMSKIEKVIRGIRN